MKTSASGVAAIAFFEGERLTAYRDSAGVWTIGIGHAATSGRPPIPVEGMTITHEQALEVLAADLPVYEAAVAKRLPSVSQHVFDLASGGVGSTGANHPSGGGLLWSSDFGATWKTITGTQEPRCVGVGRNRCWIGLSDRLLRGMAYEHGQQWLRLGYLEIDFYQGELDRQHRDVD